MILTVLTLALTALPSDGETAPGDRDSWTLSAARIYTATGDVIEDGSIRVEGGKISAVGPGSGASDFEAVTITPGLIDLSSRIHSGMSSVEQSSEVTPDLRASDAIDLFSPTWKRQVRSGVTTVMVPPAALNVIGGMGIVLKTAGEPSLEARTLREDACLNASFGGEPSLGNRGSAGPARDFYNRRPTTRMGVEWVFRKAFYDVLAKDPWPPRDAVGRETLAAVLKGDLPLVIQAHTTQDIRTACFMAEEFGLTNVIIEGAAEAWTEPKIVARSGVSIVLPPHGFGGRTDERAFLAWNSARELSALGVPIAFSGYGSRDAGTRMAHQPAYAMRAGLSFDAALEAATLQPARMLGVDDRVGSIEAGKDADLVLWSGEPFELTSRILGVLVDGKLVLDTRPTDDA